MTSHKKKGLYILDKLKVSVVAAATSVDLSSFRLSHSSFSFHLWHNSHLDNVSSSHLRFLTSTRALENLKTCDIFYCSGYKLVIYFALPFNWSIFVFSFPFDLIRSDVWGLSHVATKGGSQNYVSFIDDHTHYCWVYLMKHCFKFFKIYTTFWALIKTQHSVIIKCFMCNLNWEYTSNKFYELDVLDGTIHQTSYTYTSKQNGVTKRKHRHIVKTACSLLLSASIPNELCGEVVLTIVSLINIIPFYYILDFYFYKNFYGYAPDYSSFRAFDYTCFVLHPHIERYKLSSRSVIYVFIGYGCETL